MTDLILPDLIDRLLREPWEATHRAAIQDELRERGQWGYATLLALVAAHPASDGMRLLYADWCESERDHPRAEFVRLQVEVSGRESPFHCSDCVRIREELDRRGHRDWRMGKCPSCSAVTVDMLNKRAKALLRIHGEYWRGVRATGAVPLGWECWPILLCGTCERKRGSWHEYEGGTLRGYPG